MTMKSLLGVIGVGMLTLNIGCARETPLSPSEVNDAGSGTQAPELAATAADSYPVVTLEEDLTANPSTITVQAGSKLLVVNNSARYVRMRSNCSEFITMGLQPGDSRHTMTFEPAGQNCDYFVWDTNWSRKIFNGRVVVP
jgi:hypothetical protein